MLLTDTGLRGMADTMPALLSRQSFARSSRRSSGWQGLAEFFAGLGQTMDYEQFEPREFIAQDQYVVVILFERGRIKGGCAFDNPCVHVFKFGGERWRRLRSSRTPRRSSPHCEATENNPIQFRMSERQRFRRYIRPGYRSLPRTRIEKRNSASATAWSCSSGWK